MRMRLLTEEGPEFHDVPDEEERSIISGYWAAIRHYVGTGEDDRLSDFEGVQIADRTLLTDTDQIDYWGRAGELDFEDIYE